MIYTADCSSSGNGSGVGPTIELSTGERRGGGGGHYLLLCRVFGYRGRPSVC